METPILFHSSCNAAGQRAGWHFVPHSRMTDSDEQGQAAPTQVNVLLTWFVELKRDLRTKQ
jgi:hypothetical protein